MTEATNPVISASAGQLQTLIGYQQRLLASIRQLDDNHRAIHAHVSKLTESHNGLRQDANKLLGLRAELQDSLRSLTDAHAKTREEIVQASEALRYIQQEIQKIPNLEARLRALEQR